MPKKITVLCAVLCPDLPSSLTNSASEFALSDSSLKSSPEPPGEPDLPPGDEGFDLGWSASSTTCIKARLPPSLW